MIKRSRSKALFSFAVLATAFAFLPCAAAQSAGGEDHSAPAIHTLDALLDGRAFVKISPGEFVMGFENGNRDEQPEHRVKITKPFEMGKYEVTQSQWIAVMRDPHSRPTNRGPAKVDGPTKLNPSQFVGESLPVESVTWNAVEQFIQRLNVRDQKYTYRLPTEAEWEYAARAGEPNTRVTEGSDWYAENSGEKTHPVGAKTPNAWGLHDMLGNVREWVDDWYGLDYYAESPAADPRGPQAGSYKVYRGGGWLSELKYCRPGFRGFDFPNAANYSVGFRLVRTPK